MVMAVVLNLLVLDSLYSLKNHQGTQRILFIQVTPNNICYIEIKTENFETH